MTIKQPIVEYKLTSGATLAPGTYTCRVVGGCTEGDKTVLMLQPVLCADGHMPIGWAGRVYCEVCNQHLYDEETTTFPTDTKLFIQQLGRGQRKITQASLYGKFRGTRWDIIGFDDDPCVADHFAKQFEVPNKGPFAFLEAMRDRPQLPKDWQTNELVRLIMDRLVPVQDPEVYGMGWTF